MKPVAVLVALLATSPALAQQPYKVVGDAIPQSLTGKPGDPARGRAIVANRTVGLCLLCHGGPIPEERFQGTLAPEPGRRRRCARRRPSCGSGWSMPPSQSRHDHAPYYRLDGLARVAKNFDGKTILSAEQIEDVVAYLATLKE
jgi:sulfur-oxidizing protein SoxX